MAEPLNITTVKDGGFSMGNKQYKSLVILHYISISVLSLMSLDEEASRMV